MKVAIFDAFNGAGGDMILSSLVGLAISKSEIDEIVGLLNLKIDYQIEKVNVKGIEAKRVIVKEKRGDEREYSEIVSLIEGSDLEDYVKADSLAIFDILAKAEGKVHGRDYREAVFHEVGADDAIFDVVCCVKGIRNLINRGYRLFAKPVRTGTGFTQFSHGKYPVPPPAVLEVLKNAKIKVIFEGEGELLTPTAASILSYYCEDFPAYPLLVENVTYGAGSRETEVPNLLRLILGEVAIHDSIALIETTVDDISGEFVGYALEKLISNEKVLDVTAIPAFGKKMRTATLIKVIARTEDAEIVAEEIMRLTGSLGVRVIPVYHRIIAEREHGAVRVKIEGREFEVRFKRSMPGFRHVKPEFDDIVRIAEELSMPIHQVYRRVMKVLDDVDSNRK